MNRRTTVIAFNLISQFLFLSASYAQEVMIEPDSLDFGRTAIGEIGRPSHDRLIRIVNHSDSDIDITCEFDFENQMGLKNKHFELLLPEAAAARAAIREIVDAVGAFRQDFGEDANGIMQLAERDYLDMGGSVFRQWDFIVIGDNPITLIEAVSTREMPGGEGHRILFDFQTNQFYAEEEEYLEYGPRTAFSLPAGDEGLDLVVTFIPDEVGQVGGFLNLNRGNNGTTRCALKGRGYYNQFIEISEYELDFGVVPSGLKGRRELRITNTSGDYLQLDLDFKYEYNPDYDPSRFCMNDLGVEGVQNAMLDIQRYVDLYRERFHEEPTSVEDLMDRAGLVISDDVAMRWNFGLIDNPITVIEAISTDVLPQGEGHTILYCVQNGRFTGFGFRQYALLAKDREETFFVTFRPDSGGVFQDTLLITAWGNRSTMWNPDYQYTVVLSGAGELKVVDPIPLLPSTLTLNHPYPSPFNSSAVVTFTVPGPGLVNLSLSDIGGRSLRQWTEEVAHPCEFRLTVDAGGLAAGTYWLRLQQGENSAATRMVLVR